MKPTITILLLALASKLIAQLTIIVDAIPAITPASDPIHIAGDFQSWDAGSPAHQLVYNGDLNVHEITLAAVAGPIQFKFTRGTWPMVESDESGDFIPNRDYNYKDVDTLRLQILGWEDLSGGGNNNSTAAENVSILSTDFYMTELDRNRRVWLYLPPDYATSGLDYPVIYMQDGQNVFDASTSFSGEWGVDETLNDLYANGDPGVIVVAIDNGQEFRMGEYIPWPHPVYGGGDGEAYINFIIDDLKPYIDANYRTLSERDHTAIMGSSLGGLISTYAGVTRQDVFSKVGIFSPAYWVSNPQIYELVSTTGKEQPMRFYQLMGSLEGSNNTALMYEMQLSLSQAGFGPEEVQSEEHNDGEHSEWYWNREFEATYLWLFRSEPNAVDETQSWMSASLSPNPAKDRLRLTFRLEEVAEIEVDITDTLGRWSRQVFTGELSTGEQELELELGDLQLPAGTYLCRIKAGIKTESVKFVVAE